MYLKIGSYTGDGVDDRQITGLGFSPDLVIVKCKNTNEQGMFMTSSMADFSLPMRADESFSSDCIKSIIADGFTIGTNARVNNSGDSYFYLACRNNGAGDFAKIFYTGDGTDGKAITGLGFQPDYVFIKPNDTIVGAQRFSTASNTSMNFAGANRSDLIASLDSDGFTVNNGSADAANLVNRSGIIHYGFAFKNTTNRVKVFSYTGNGADNRDITTPGFPPGFVLIKGEAANSPSVRTTAHSGDEANSWEFQTVANIIQSFSATGFQVGTDGSSNTNTVIYHALVLADPTNLTYSSGAGAFFL